MPTKQISAEAYEKAEKMLLHIFKDGKVNIFSHVDWLKKLTSLNIDQNDDVLPVLYMRGIDELQKEADKELPFAAKILKPKNQVSLYGELEKVIDPNKNLFDYVFTYWKENFALPLRGETQAATTGTGTKES